jgi:hypothetical protein
VQLLLTHELSHSRKLYSQVCNLALCSCGSPQTFGNLPSKFFDLC